MEIVYDKGSGVLDVNGDKEWYLNGKLHRLDGSAIEYRDGDKSWYLNGKKHRTDGPASEWASGDEWWLNGKRILTQITNPIIGEKIEIYNAGVPNDIGIVLKHVEGVFYEILLGNKKILAYKKEIII